MGHTISKSNKQAKADPPPTDNLLVYTGELQPSAPNPQQYPGYPGGQMPPLVPTSPLMYCNPDYVNPRLMGQRHPDYYTDDYCPLPRPRLIDRPPRRLEYLSDVTRRHRDLDEMDYFD